MFTVNIYFIDEIKMSDYNQINYVFLALGLINGTLFVVSETLGFFNRHSTRCTSMLELLGRWFRVLREPNLEEVLNHLQERRQNQLT
jgi:hypothetical protein